jgi:hypothetical protein
MNSTIGANLNMFKLNSTQNSTGTNSRVLDYTFISHKSNILKDKQKDSSKEYLFDLTNTWELNLELIESLLKDTLKLNPEEYNILKDAFKKI